jgi:hypothetical protein
MVSSRRSNDRPRRRPWELLLLLLALLMSLSCVFFATWLALRVRPNVLDEANMLPKSRADYRRLPGEEILFAPLDPALGIEAATDVARLARTPVSSATPAGIVMLPPTPTVTPTPTPALVATRVPVPTASPVPTATDLPTPTRPPSTVTPTVVPPTSTTTATRAPTLTPVATDTPVATPTWLPTDTPIPTSTSIPTDTPVPPTPTVVPTDTPEPPTPTPTEVRPIVQAILPNTMVNTDTVTVTITGLNFQADCSVSLGSVLLVGPTCTPTTTIVASVPADIVAGYYDLTVTNTVVNQSGTLAGAYTATNPIPLVTDITPAVTVINTTDLAIDISGDYFRNTGSPGSLRANLGTTDLADLTFVNSTMLTATVPATSPVMALGAYTLTVTNPGPTDPTGSLVNAFTVYTYTTMCEPVPDCNNAIGEPDGVSADITYPTVITIDFGAGGGITDGPGYDIVFYEWANPDIDPGPGVLRGVLLDYVTIQLVEEGSGTAYTVFEWNGDNPGDVAGTNIDSYATDADGELDNEPIPYYDLYPAPPPVPPNNNSGIAIDIGIAAQAVQPPQAPLPLGQFRWVRVSVPTGSSDAAQIDAIVRLN